MHVIDQFGYWPSESTSLKLRSYKKSGLHFLSGVGLLYSYLYCEETINVIKIINIFVRFKIPRLQVLKQEI